MNRPGAIESLTGLLARIPGIGSRSGRRIVLFLLRNRNTLLPAMIDNLQSLRTNVTRCDCGNLDEVNPCSICADISRHGGVMCVVDDVVSIWAIERSAVFRGLYHVLDNILSPINGKGPESLGLERLHNQVRHYKIQELVLALNPTVEGQATAEYIKATTEVHCSALRVGIPMGAELDYLDVRTIGMAMEGRE
jgi:recombination protein RecR